MTIDEAILKLMRIREQAKFGGDTVLAICLDQSEIEMCNVKSITYEADPDGALVVVHGKVGE